MYCKHTISIKLNGQILKASILKPGKRQDYPLSPCIFNIVLEVLAKVVRPLEEIKWIQIGNEEFKVWLFADGIIVCCMHKGPKNFYQGTPTAYNHL